MLHAHVLLLGDETGHLMWPFFYSCHTSTFFLGCLKLLVTSAVQVSTFSVYKLKNCSAIEKRRFWYSSDERICHRNGQSAWTWRSFCLTLRTYCSLFKMVLCAFRIQEK